MQDVFAREWFHNETIEAFVHERFSPMFDAPW